MARETPPEAGAPGWMVTYGDLMSLLLCFFVLLFSMSSLEAEKMAATIESINEAFGYKGSGTASNIDVVRKRIDALNNRGRRSRVPRDRSGTPPPPSPVPIATHHSEFRIERVDEELVRGGLIWFEFGSDELNARARQDLDRLCEQLAGSPYQIMVKGHAGVGEEGIYRRAIDLSYTRAVNVFDYLVARGLSEKDFQITCVGAHEPIRRSLLPAGSDPRQAYAVVQVVLLSNVLRRSEEATPGNLPSP